MALRGSITAATALIASIEKFQSTSRSWLILGSAGLAALTLVLRFVLSKDVRYISNLSNVGRLATENESEEYDIIIVGGGTAGCALASRLSENPNIRVLVLEAGGSGTALMFSRTPSLYGNLYQTPHVYNFRTEPQASAKGRTQFFPRAKLLGGCSSINTQMAQYGSPEDFNQWAQFIEDDSWSWKHISRYFTKFERYQPHPDYPLVDTSLRGSTGPVRIGYFNTETDKAKDFVKACINVGIPFTPDFHGPLGTMGVSRVMTYIDQKYQRVSAESAYLTKDVLKRRNLKVATHAQVTRVLFETVDGEKRAVGVEFGNSKSGPRYQAMARKEVVICGGAVHSPQILMLSGIGPAEHLEKHGIPIVHDLPGVGSHFVDHPVVDLYFKDKLDKSLKYLKPVSFLDSMKVFSAFVQYFILRSGGPLATNWGESAAFIRTDDPVLFPKSEYPESLPDSTAGPNSPDLELFTTSLAYKEHGRIFFDVHTYSLHVYVVKPSSTGSVLLKSSSPWDLPSIDPNYLSSPDDTAKLLRGVRLLLRIAQTQPLSTVLDGDSRHKDLDHQLHLKSDEELIELIKERVETVYHPASSCRMAPSNKRGVVDSKLRVYGIRGLRVCDASIFPWLVSGHTTGACYAIAEKLADELKTEFSAGSSYQRQAGRER